MSIRVSIIQNTQKSVICVFAEMQFTILVSLPPLLSLFEIFCIISIVMAQRYEKYAYEHFARSGTEPIAIFRLFFHEVTTTNLCAKNRLRFAKRQQRKTKKLLPFTDLQGIFFCKFKLKIVRHLNG